MICVLWTHTLVQYFWFSVLRTTLTLVLLDFSTYNTQSCTFRWSVYFGTFRWLVYLEHQALTSICTDATRMSAKQPPRRGGVGANCRRGPLLTFVRFDDDPSWTTSRVPQSAERRTAALKSTARRDPGWGRRPHLGPTECRVLRSGGRN